VGVQPDLTTLSKALGNGWPVAAVVGRRDVMESAAGLHVSATYHGETTGMAAALAVLDQLAEEDVAGYVDRLGRRLIDGLNELASRHRVPAVAYGEPLPPMPFLRFTPQHEGARDALVHTFYGVMLERGILFHPRHLWFVSRAHTSRDIDRALQAADEAFAITARAHGPLL
jgi:glutamate-1-semialdehyde 2,1-aminomutase